MKTRAPLESCICIAPLACVLTLLTVGASTSLGATLNVPADYATIQAAIDAASNGDTVVVHPGTYRETINFLGEAITVRSMDPTDPQVVQATVIDGLWDGLKHGPIVTFENGEGNDSIVAGLTITNGWSPANPIVGGILCRGASPTIEWNTIAGNGGYAGVGGVACLDNSAPLIRGNTISGNSGSTLAAYAGGILCKNGSSPAIESNTIIDNTGGGITCFLQSSPAIERNLIARNNAYSGGGIFCCDSEPLIGGNTIEGNTTQTLGGGIACQYSAPTISGNTIRGNSAPDREGGGIHCRYGSSPLIKANIIEENWATQGGGIACDYEAAPRIEANTIAHNRATDTTGGAVYCCKVSPTIVGNTMTYNSARRGGAIGCYMDCAPLISGNTIAHNSATYRGGAIAVSMSSSPTVVSDNDITDNTAGAGGAIELHTASATIADNTIKHNQASGPPVPPGTYPYYSNGGAIWCVNSAELAMRRNVMADNTAVADGGAMWVDSIVTSLALEANTVTDNEAGMLGGALVTTRVVSGTTSANTFSRNSAGGSGGGMWISGATIAMAEDVITDNTAGNGGAGLTVVNAGLDFAVTISHTVVAGNGRDNGLPGIAMVRIPYGGLYLRAKVSECSIYDNGGLGIDAGGDGVTPNEPGDFFTDFPVFTDIATIDGLATVTGTAPPGSTVEVYAAAPDPTRYGEGKTYLQSLTAGPTGFFTCTVPVSALPITATATDASGNTSEFSRCIPDNGAPVAVAGGPYSVAEGASTTVDAGGSSDPDEGDVLTFAWDLDGDGTFETSGQAVTFSAADLDGPSERTISVQVTDSSGLSATDAATVTVENVAPTVTDFMTSLDPIAANVSTTATVTFTDPCASDTHKADWDWGDGTTTATDPATNPIGADHTYSTPGIYTVTVTVTDDDGGSDSAISQYVVIYDPTGAFVTGGGTIDSPAGAFAADPSLSGIAHFGFVARYQPGATVPSGNTRFCFKTADLTFVSESFEWLVVAGSKAMYKGTGTISGGGDYGFMLSAIDGDLKDPKEPDRFRIRIWDRATGMVVYDNQLEAEDDADPTTAISGGSIVVHRSDVAAAAVTAITGATAMQTDLGAQVVLTLTAEAKVTADVLNISGRLVGRVCTDRVTPAGTNTLVWNARSTTGTRVPAGRYLVRVVARSANGQQAQSVVPLSIKR